MGPFHFRFTLLLVLYVFSGYIATHHGISLARQILVITSKFSAHSDLHDLSIFPTGCKGEENPGGGFSDRKESATRGSNRIEMQRPEADAMQRGVEGVRARVAYPLNEQVATEAPQATETPVGTGRYMVFFRMYRRPLASYVFYCPVFHVYTGAGVGWGVYGVVRWYLARVAIVEGDFCRQECVVTAPDEG